MELPMHIVIQGAGRGLGLAFAHRALVCRNNYQCEVYTAHTRDHSIDEAVMAGHVNKADIKTRIGLQKSISELYRQPTVLFFLESICINPR